MARIIVVTLKKGGVGKTTTVQHLGHALAMMGKHILMIDADPQASLTRRYDFAKMQASLADVIGAEGPPTHNLEDVIIETQQDGLFLAPAATHIEDERLSLSNERLASAHRGKFVFDLLLRDMSQSYDYILIDTPPGDSELLLAALTAADEVILPVHLSAMGMEGFTGIDATIMKARDLQELRGEIRLRLLAVLPTFYSEGEVSSDNSLYALKTAEHPDYIGQPLPMAPMPVVETTAFERVSTRVRIKDEERARTIFEIGDSPGSPIERGKQSYMQLAKYVEVNA